MKKILKYSCLSLFGIILLSYLVLAGFFYLSEFSLKNELSNSKAVYSRIQEPHPVTLINDGVSSLAKRLELIDSAKESVELEFFIYEIDLSSKLITNALIRAAKRGVEVKILVDFSVSIFKLRPLYAKYLKQFKIDVRYYNTAHSSRIVSIQHRSHRKLMIVDRKFSMTGGRNIGDDYFSLSSHYNFVDSDIVIEGEITEAIRKSFYDYWSSPYTSEPDLSRVQTQNKVLFSLDEKAQQVLKQINDKKAQINSHLLKSTCHDIAFVTDFPGVALSNRQVYLHLVEFLKEAKSHVEIETPYFILRNDGYRILKSLHDRKIVTNILTNSLYSSDAFYTVSAMTFYLDDLADLNLGLNLHNGKKPRRFVEVIPKGTISERWGTHSKRAVIDNKHTLIGTYNIDPRSANLNSEVMIICRNSPNLARHTLENIKLRTSSSQNLIHNKKINYSAILNQATTKKKIYFFLSMPIVWLLSFLL